MRFFIFPLFAQIAPITISKQSSKGAFDLRPFRSEVAVTSGRRGRGAGARPLSRTVLSLKYQLVLIFSLNPYLIAQHIFVGGLKQVSQSICLKHIYIYTFKRPKGCSSLQREAKSSAGAQSRPREALLCKAAG